jgi:hypothetical protein
MLEKYKEKFINFLNKTEKYKLNVYIYAFLLYFFLYFLITIPQISKDAEHNILFDVANKFSNNKIVIISIFIVILCVLITFSIYFVKKIDKFSISKQIYIILGTLTVLFIYICITILTFYKSLTNISGMSITKYIFYGYSYMLYFIMIYLFFYNIEKKINMEFIISVLMIVLFFAFYYIFNYTSLKKVYYQLQNYDYSTLSINCFVNGNQNERFINQDNKEQSTISNESIQLKEIAAKYGDNYLKTDGNIPISFYNNKSKTYQDLILADFYYPGSYYSYLADTPLNGTPSLTALELTLTKFKARILHLDIYSDLSDNHDTNANPVVSCKNMNPNGVPLKLMDCLSTIKKYGWMESHPKKSYPIFLYLNFEFDESEAMYIKIYNLLMGTFSKNLIDKKYSFSGRNGTFSFSKAKMKDCLNKIIILTNRYPTKTILDEIINGCSNDLSHDFNMKLYKETYSNYDKLGISQDYNKNDLINQSKLFTTFFYSEPNALYKNNNQAKAGLFNPSFQDCAQYGIQSSLMYLFLPDDNLNKWYHFFKNKNNFDPVLKDEVLRFIESPPFEPVKQNPILGLQKPQKYCVIPGLIETHKSNLSGQLTNNSCNTK